MVHSRRSLRNGSVGCRSRRWQRAALLTTALAVIGGSVATAAADPGPSTSNQTITVTNASGATAPDFTFRLERCTNTTGTACTGATAVGTTSGSNNASGDSAALTNGSSWFWGSPTTLEYERNYRLSVITALPASLWELNGRGCNPDGGSTTNSGATAIVMRLSDSNNNRRATCTFTFVQTGGTITANKGGLRNTGSNNTATFATGLQGATFEHSPNANFAAPVNDLCVTPVSTDATGACVSAQLANDDYYVREKAAPASWNTIPQIAYGGDAFSQSPVVPYTQQVEVDDSNETTRRFVNRMSNPPTVPACGLNVSLVLDRSGSIEPNASTYAGAAKGFVDALAFTPSQMKIFSFATTSSADQNTFVSLETQAGVDSLNDTIDDVYDAAGGGTNWDAGLQEAITSGSQVVLFITDGNPTARNGDTGSTNIVNLEDVEYGIASANSVKNAGQTVVAVGVANQGSGGITPTNLELVSGPGDFFTANLDTIEDLLRALANQLCGSRIHVRKLVDGQPQTGWTFTVAGGGPGVTFGNNPVATAGAGGEGVIGVNGISANGTTPVTVTETLAGHPGFTFDTAACQLDSYPAANTGSATNPQTIAQIQRNQDWYCTFNNVFNKFPSTTETVIHDASHATVTSVPVGTTVHDQAAVTGAQGTPTGTVTFSWFTNGTCTGEPVATSSPFALDGSGVADGTTFTQTPALAGDFAFRASYSGDGVYDGSTGPCEPLTVTKIDSTTDTLIHDAAHAVVTSVLAGTTVHDQATVTGALETPTGTVTFSWFTNGTCTGEPAATSEAVPLAGGTVDATTFTQTPATAGEFAFQATYSGNNVYNGSTGPCEHLDVIEVSPTTVVNSTTTTIPGSTTIVTSGSTVTTVPTQPTVPVGPSGGGGGSSGLLPITGINSWPTALGLFALVAGAVIALLKRPRRAMR